MIAAGISHHWSVQTLLSQNPNIREMQITATLPLYKETTKSENPPKAVTTPSKMAEAIDGPSKEEFFNTLVAELRKLKNENHSLRDQMGETNRDVMKLAFRVDTHSESFRPLPVSEDRNDTSFNFDSDDLPGVLPPRAEPVYLGND